jgi:hypothetical protein
MQWSYLESFTEDSPSSYFKKQSVTTPTQQKTCKKGQKYIMDNNECKSCEDGTYQDATNHTLATCKSHLLLKDLRDQCSGYILTNEYNTKINEKNKKFPLTREDKNDLCKPHRSLKDLRRDCSGEYILQGDYDDKLKTKKDSALTSEELCISHDSLSDLRRDCSGEYILQGDYDDKLKTKKDSALTSEELCISHDSLSDLRSNCSDGYILQEDYDDKLKTKKDSALTSEELCISHDSLSDLRSNCSGGYILANAYNKKISEKKKSALTQNEKQNLCKPHEQITCEISKILNQNLYNEKKKDKTKPIKYEDVCKDDKIYLRLKFLKNGLDNKKVITISQDDINNMLTYHKVTDFRL